MKDLPPILVIALDSGAEDRPYHPYGSPLWQLQQMSDALHQYMQTLSRGHRAFDEAANPHLVGQGRKIVLEDATITGMYLAGGTALKVADLFLPSASVAADILLGVGAAWAVKGLGAQAALALDFKHSDHPLLDAIEILQQHDPDVTLQEIKFGALGDLYGRSVYSAAVPFFRREMFRRNLRRNLAALAKPSAEPDGN